MLVKAEKQVGARDGRCARADNRRRFAFAGLMVLVSIAARAGATDIHIAGTGNALGTMRLLGVAFEKAHAGSKVIVHDSIGTSGAIKAMAKGVIDIGLSARPLTDEETRAGLRSTEYARSPTVFAVHKRNLVESITLQQVADIYRGRLTSWPDGTLVRLVARQTGDDNTAQIKGLSTELAQAVAIAEQRQGLLFAVTDQEVADHLESVPGSLGVTTLALIRSEKRALRPLKIAGVEPTPQNASAGRYPLLKRFYFVLLQAPALLAREFVDFVKSPQARLVLEQTGHSPP